MRLQRQSKSRHKPLSVVDARKIALDLLRRREHSRQELSRKLHQRGYDTAIIDATIDALTEQGWQSDQRFADAFVHSRVQRGVGPLRIQVELKRRGIADALITAALADYAEQWSAVVLQAYRKRYREQTPQTVGEVAQRVRFLQGRGFTPKHIKLAINIEEVAISS